MSNDGNGTTFSAWIIGSDSLAVECAEMLRARGHELRGVITDAEEIRRWADENGVRAVDASSDYAATLAAEPFDHLFAITWLSLIPENVLALPTRYAINYHDAPLPAYSGLNCTTWALLNGETRHGISWHIMTAGVDEGELLCTRSFAIEPDETSLSLNTRCFEHAIESFGVLADDLAEKREALVPQAAGPRREYRRKDQPEAACAIDWTRPATEIHRLVRALDFGPYTNPLGIAKLHVRNTWLGLLAATPCENPEGLAPGTLFALGEDLVIGTGDGALRIDSLANLHGRPIALEDSGLVPGDRATLFSEAERNELSAIHADVCRSERFLMRRLERLAPAAAPGANQDFSTWQTVRSTIPIQIPPTLQAHFGTDTRDALIAGFGCLLARVSGEPRLDVGFSNAPLHHRTGAFEALYTSRVPFRFDLDGELAFDEIVRGATRERERLLRHSTWIHDAPARHPALAGRPEIESGALLPVGLRIVEGNAELCCAESALTLVLNDAGAAFAFDADAIAPATVHTLAGQLETLLTSAAERPSAGIGELNLLSDAERQRVLHAWNQSTTDFRRDLCMHGAFQEQAARTPEETALTFRGASLGYRELDVRANQLAQHLRAQGVETGARVGIAVGRSHDLVVAALATLKAGAAYVPLDPDYPADRIALMVEDAGLSAIVTRSQDAHALPDCSVPRVTLDTDHLAISACPSDLPETGVTPEDVAYVIYTSGSTGRPKGVMVQHRNALNFFTGMDARIPHDPPGTWLAVTSLSFDISVLELFWTLARGFHVVIHEGETVEAAEATSRPVDFGLFYFSSDDSSGDPAERYRLLIEGAKFADSHGFASVWTPERHFHAFGGLFPNPAVTGAALATITQNVAIRAGSVVLPLHHPARVAEEWSVVDNLSGGRAGIAVASGWQPNDFILQPQNFANAKQVLIENTEIVRRLWRGEAIPFEGPRGEAETRVLPRPVQAELPLWMTTAGNVESYEAAGRIGAGVLTHLLGQSTQELAEKIAVYRDAFAQSGHAGEGHVALMLHTFVGSDRESIRETVREPMIGYLRSSLGLVKGFVDTWAAFKKRSDGTTDQKLDMGSLSSEEMDDLLAFSFERYFDTSALFGTVESCTEMVDELAGAGVDEVAALVDFGIETDVVLDHLGALDEVRQAAAARSANAGQDFSLGALLRRHQVTHFQCTPSMLRMILMDPQAKRALRGISTLLLGGEPFPVALLAELRALTDAEIINVYGPTETTIWSSSQVVEGHETKVSIGTPIANTQLYVVDEQLQPLPVGVSGELLIGGDGVTLGYLGREELTAERFIENPFIDEPGARVYRTGDRAAWLPDGRIDFLGRMDHQVKVRGYRIELGEIETVLSRHAGVREAVVMAREDAPGERRLVAYYVATGSGARADALRSHARGVLPEYMVPSAFVCLDDFPLTPNKKVDRRALPAPETVQDQEREVEAPRTETERAIATIWSEILGVGTIGIDDSFFDLGGHSLLAVKTQRELAERFDREVRITDLFRRPTIRSLAELFDAGSEPEPTVPPAVATEDAPRPERAPLSFAQERLWFLERFEPGTPINNNPFHFGLRGAVDVARLQSCLDALAQRHEGLRTTFVQEKDTPQQRIAAEGHFPLRHVDLSEHPADEREAALEELVAREVATPFDFENGPLCRALLVSLDADHHELFPIVHHIVSDGWSIRLIFQELASLYGAAERSEEAGLAPLGAHYAEFAHWQRESLGDQALSASLDWWRDQYTRAPLPLELPRDAAFADAGNAAAEVSVELPAATADALRSLAQGAGATLYMSVLSSLAALLSRLSGQDDLVIGSPVAERERAESEGVVGLFLNVVPIRIDLSGDPSFDTLQEVVRDAVLGAYEHREVPFEKLVDALQRERDPSRHPLFDVMLNFDVLANTSAEAGNLTFELEKPPLSGARLPLELYADDLGDALRVRFVYPSALFSQARMEEMASQLGTLLEQIVAAPELPLSHHSLITAGSQRILPDPAEPLPKPALSTLSERIAARASLSPDRVVLRQGANRWTSEELDQRANEIARAIVAHGVEKGQRVAVTGARSPALVTAMLGVLRAGGVLLLLDPDLPATRRRVMRDAADARLLLDLHGELDEVARGIEVLALDPVTGGCATAAEAALPTVTGDDDAYVFFTSGTTGTPKGVLGTHAGLSHFIDWQGHAFEIGSEDRAAQLTALSFDVVLRDVFTPLCHGAVLCIPEAEVSLAGRHTLAWLEREQITMLHTVPTVIANWLGEVPADTRLSQLRLLFSAGEPLSDGLVTRWRERFPGSGIVNLYGPTETTLAKAFHPVDEVPRPGTQPVGRALPQTQLLVLSGTRRCGVGECGEIVIRTPFRTRGYLNASEEQQARFEPSPFGAASEDDDLLYRTGDRGRYLPDGTLEILGRVDHQVKIRGLRIELGEIEAALAQHTDVRRSVVITDGDGTDKRLIAYCATERGTSTTELRRHLSERLPAAMVPAAFVTLETLPLTPNGKVDRRALPAPSEEPRGARGSFVEPRDEFERQLAKIWEEVLDVSPVGIHDDFFELGGHSLLALRLVGEIEAQFGREIPLPTLFTASTVEELAAALRSDERLPANSAELVTLRPGGNRPPLFCICGIFLYRELAQHLPEEQPVHAVYIKSELEVLAGGRLEGEGLPRLEEMAAAYREQIQAVQPHGPYSLAGVSFGGLLAYEVAQQLRDAGEEVSYLALFDTLLPSGIQREPLSWFAHQAKLALQRGPRDTLERLAGRLLGTRARSQPRDAGFFDRMAEEAGDDTLARTAEREGTTELRRSRGRIYTHAKENYQPRPYTGPMGVFRAANREYFPGYRVDRELGWSRHARQLEVLDTPGTHLGILQAPHVETLARQLTERLPTTTASDETSEE